MCMCVWMLTRVAQIRTTCTDLLMNPGRTQKNYTVIQKTAPWRIRLNSSITIHVNIMFCYNVCTTNLIQQVTVCAWNVHQELWHKHEDEYATVLMRYWWCADWVHPTRRRYVLAAQWCPSRGVCKPPASPTRFCRTVRWLKCWWYEVLSLLVNISTVSHARCEGALSWYQYYKVSCVCRQQVGHGLSCCLQPLTFSNISSSFGRKGCEMTMLYDKMLGAVFLNHGVDQFDLLMGQNHPPK